MKYCLLKAQAKKINFIKKQKQLNIILMMKHYLLKMKKIQWL